MLKKIFFLLFLVKVVICVSSNLNVPENRGIIAGKNIKKESEFLGLFVIKCKSFWELLIFDKNI